MQKEEFGGGGREEAGDVRSRELVNAFEVHVVVEPLHFIDDVQATMHNEGIHLPCLSAEASNAIPALFRCAKFELEQWVVARTNDAEVV